MKPIVFLTGYQGYIGSAIVERLEKDSQYQIIASTRKDYVIKAVGAKVVTIGNIDGETKWEPYLSNVNVVIHTAARVHLMHDSALNPLKEFRKVNVEGTLNLARQAAAKGVKRFIFISSVKVNGEFTDSKHKFFTTEDKANPIDPYGVSKFEAEEGLKKITKETGLEVVIIRPPLVYGPGVKANFLSMMKWVKKGVPLPFGAITNKRSFVAVDNLVDLIVTCMQHPYAKNQTFLVSDDKDISTTDLLKKMASALGEKIILIPVPMNFLRIVFFLIGKKSLSPRLMGSLQVDIKKTKDLLNWKPPISMDEALLKTAKAFLETK